MSAVRNVSELVERIAPSVGSESAPSPDLFRCRNCGRDVEPDADACQNCSSTNLRPLYL